MAKEVKISRVASIEPDGGGFHMVLISGSKRIELYASRSVLLAGTELARIALAKDTKAIIIPMEGIKCQTCRSYLPPRH